jgi:hypothetical protein
MFQGNPGVSPLPYMLYAAPNALFPLMTLFLLIRLEESLAFVPLYITGKLISLAALLGWLFFSIRELGGLSGSMIWALFLCAADFGTVMGMALLKNAVPVRAAGGSTVEPELPEDNSGNGGG